MSLSLPLRYRDTGTLIGMVFGGLALASVGLSAAVMLSRPWSCSATDASPVSCDWVTSKAVAAVFLVAGVGVSVLVWKRITAALAAISLPLLALSVLSFLGVYTLAPAALWVASAGWLWAGNRTRRMVASIVLSVVLIYLAAMGTGVVLAVRSAPV